MRSITTYLFILVSAMLFLSCSQLFYSSQSSDEYTIDETGYQFELLTNDSTGNLRIIMEGESDDFILCVDGEIIGIVPENSDITTKIELDANELKNLWLIPLSDIDNKDDAILENTRYRWVAKLYVSGIIREWRPGENTTSESGSITFFPPSADSSNWDYVIGYLNGDETSPPLAVLSPYDNVHGVSTVIDYGRLSITWKYYKNDSGNGNFSLVYEVMDDFIFTIDDAGNGRDIPALECTEGLFFRLSLINNENYIVRLYLNGEPIEEYMEEIKIGYSNIEGTSSRTYDLLAEGLQNLAIYNDGGEIAQITFAVNEEEEMTMAFSETEGIVITAREPLPPNRDFEDQAVFAYAFNGSIDSHIDSVTPYVNNVAYTSDRFENSHSALSLGAEYSRFGLYEDSGVMNNTEFTYTFWIKSYGSQVGATLFQCGKNNTGNLVISYDETIGLDLKIYPYAGSSEVTRTGTNNKSLSDGQWHMISLIKSCDAIRLYIDKEMVEEDADHGSEFIFPDFCLFGGSGLYDYFYFKGAIDDFLYFDCALNIDELDILYKK